MKLLVFGDLQACENSEHCFHDPSKPLQIFRVEKLLQLLADIKGAEPVDGLVDLGDTTDDRSSISIRTLQTVIPGLSTFKDTQAHNIKLIGNHEQSFKSVRVHPGLSLIHI